MRKAEVRACALSEQNPTFQELSHNWEGSISLGVKASTITHYQYTLKHYIIPVLGDYRVQELDEYTLERSLLEIITPTDNSHKPLGATMARECLVLVRRICRYAAHLHLMRSLEIDVKTTNHLWLRLLRSANLNSNTCRAMLNLPQLLGSLVHCS